MATVIQILTTNYSGETAQITFTPCSGGTIDLGNQVLPYNYESENYQGSYSLYFSAFTKTCTFDIPCPTLEPTQTPTPTPTIDICIDCPTGYTWTAIDGSSCVALETVSATAPQYPLTAYTRTYYEYSMSGTTIFEPGWNVNGTGTVNTVLNTPSVWKNTSTTNGPLNRTGLWVDLDTADPVDYPLNVWVGFNFCVTGFTGGTYYIGLGADNEYRLEIDGNVILDTSSVTGTPESLDKFRKWHVYPVTLTGGQHIIGLYGYNQTNPGINPAGFGCEIYNNTLSELVNANNINDLNIIFSSTEFIGEIIQVVKDGNGQYLTSGYTCPTGYEYAPCDGTCWKNIYCPELPTPTPTPTPTSTDVPPTPTPTPTSTDVPPPTQTPTPTSTDVPPTPTPTPTSTDVPPPPSNTPTPTPTSTDVPPTPTPTPTTESTPTPTPTFDPYFYYSVRQYDCSDNCEVIGPDLAGRSSAPLSTTDGVYYKLLGQPNVYQVQTEITPAPMSYDIDFDTFESSHSDCIMACGITLPTPTPTPTQDLTFVTTYTISGCTSSNLLIANLISSALAPGDTFFLEFTGATLSECYTIVNKIDATPDDGSSPITFYPNCADCINATTTTPTPTSTDVPPTPTPTQTPTQTPTPTSTEIPSSLSIGFSSAYEACDNVINSGANILVDGMFLSGSTLCNSTGFELSTYDTDRFFGDGAGWISDGINSRAGVKTGGVFMFTDNCVSCSLASTPTPTPTATDVPPTPTPTATEVPPTATPTPTSTDVPPTPTPTSTDVPPTPTPTETPTSTPVPPTPTSTETPTPTPTNTPSPTPTPTLDVYFYYDAERYECLPDGSCNFIENIVVANATELLILNRYRIDPTTGYILMATESTTSQVSLLTTMVGPGTSTCRNLCTQPTPTPTSTPVPPTATPVPTPLPTSTPIPPTPTDTPLPTSTPPPTPTISPTPTATPDQTPNWVNSGTYNCYSTCDKYNVEIDNNVNSLSYNQTRQGSLVASNSVDCGGCCGQSTAPTWTNEGAAYCESCVSKQLQRDTNPCSATYNSTQVINSGSACDTSQNWVNSGTYDCYGTCNKYNVEVQNNPCATGYNTTKQGTLVESNSTFCYVEGTNCCGQSTAAVWFANGQTTCVGVDKYLVEEDMNPCSATSGQTRTGNLFESNSVDCGYITPTPTPTATGPQTVVYFTINYESAFNEGNITGLEIFGSDYSSYPVTILSGTFPLTAVGQSITATSTHYDGEYSYDSDGEGTYLPVKFEPRLSYNNIGGGLDRLVVTKNDTETICGPLDSPSGFGASQFPISSMNLGDSFVIKAQSGICS
jgi:hypothetical protein